MKNYNNEDIKVLFYALLAEIVLLSKYESIAFFAREGMQIFLENVKQNKPEVFADKQFILSLIRDIPRELELEKSDRGLLESLYWGYLEKELQKDKEILMAFLLAERYGYEDPCYLEYGDSVADVPYGMFGFSHDFATDEEVFCTLLRKTDPVSIYTEVLSDSEKLDDAMIGRLLKWYEEHLYGPDYVLDKLYDNLKQFQTAWVESIREQYCENEEAERIYENINPYVKSCFSGLVEEFLDSIRVVSPYGEERDPNIPARLLMDQYVSMIAEKVQDEIDSVSEYSLDGKEERIRAMKAFDWEKSFEKILSPYLHQMELFDRVFLGDFTVLDEEECREEAAEEKEQDKGGNDDIIRNNPDGDDDSFMNVPIDNDNNLPFS